jgi:alpha-amylase
VDKVVIALDAPKGKKSISVKGIFGDGTKLYDRFSETEVTVDKNKVMLDNDFDVVLLELSN